MATRRSIASCSASAVRSGWWTRISTSPRSARLFQHARDVRARHPEATRDLLLRHVVEVILLGHVGQLQVYLLSVIAGSRALVHGPFDSPDAALPRRPAARGAVLGAAVYDAASFAAHPRRSSHVLHDGTFVQKSR